MSPKTPPDDLRDAHLVAALRHAPDRDVAPPAQLTAAILGQARQALRAQQRRPREPLRAAWARLWQPAPLAAFGTLALATLIGVMWGGQPVPDARPGLRPETGAATPAAQAQRAASAAPVPAAAAANMERAAAQRRKPEGNAERPRRTEPVTRQAPQQNSGDVAADRKLIEPLATAPRTVSPAAVPAAPAQAPAEPEARRDVLGKSIAEAAPAETRARSEQPATRASEPRASELVARQLGAAAPSVLAPLAPAGLEIDGATRSDPTRVRWRLTQRWLAHDAAQRDWWAALVGTTQGRWQRAGTGSVDAVDEAAVALVIDGASRGSLSFEPQAVLWRDANGVAWRAPVAAQTLRAWQEALARW